MTDAAVVTVVGETRVELPLALPADHGFETRTLSETFRCSSGSPISTESTHAATPPLAPTSRSPPPGAWTGLALDDLLCAADAPDETTHVVVEGDDGFRVCVPIAAALGGVLAYEGVDADARPRFVAPGISGTRTVQRVRHVEATTLDGGTDPASLEELRLEATG
ncbi:MAG: molybdopterin-dependent oxidoreductase [Haloferacaceae archaeon]